MELFFILRECVGEELIKFVKKYPTFKHNWNKICASNIINLNMINKYYSILGGLSNYYRNPKTKPEFIDNDTYYIDVSPYHSCFYSTTDIINDILASSPKETHIWRSASKNPNITVDFIKQYINKPWD